MAVDIPPVHSEEQVNLRFCKQRAEVKGFKWLGLCWR
jgi:hypothetical protein